MPAKKTRKRTAKPKPPAEEPLMEVTEPEPVGGPATPVPFGSEKITVVPPDGTLIRGDGGPVVYVMQDGRKRPLRDALVFAACGFGWNEIVVLSPEEIDPIPVGEVVARQSDLQGA